MAVNVVFNRGKGGGAGPVDYLLGKDRQREMARLLRGDPEQMIELIDSLKFAQNYTSGCLSFEEPDIPEEHKQQLMDGLESTLLPGLDRDQYSVMWVEHRDKGRLELNYVFANVELQSGKNLQPYVHKADKFRVNSWLETVRHDYQLADPNDPIRRRAVCTAKDLPPEKKMVVHHITGGLLARMEAGLIKDRADIVATLEADGFKVARQVKGSISIEDPEHPGDKTKNIRLQGLIYERDFAFSGDLSEAIRDASERYRKDTERRVQQARKDLDRMLEHRSQRNAGRYSRDYAEPEIRPSPASRELEGGLAGQQPAVKAVGPERLALADVDHGAAVRSQRRGIAPIGELDSRERPDAGRAEGPERRATGPQGLESVAGRGQGGAGAAERVGEPAARQEQERDTNDFFGNAQSTGKEVIKDEHRDPPTIAGDPGHPRPGRASDRGKSGKAKAGPGQATEARKPRAAELDARAAGLPAGRGAAHARAGRGGRGAAPPLHVVRSLQNRPGRMDGVDAGEQGRTSRAAGVVGNPLSLRGAAQRLAGIAGFNVRDVRATTNGEIDHAQRYRGAGGFIGRIRDYAGGTLERGRDAAQRAAKALQLFFHTAGKVEHTAREFDRAAGRAGHESGEFNQAAGRRDVADGAHDRAGQQLERTAGRLGELAGDLDQTAQAALKQQEQQQKQREQQQAKPSRGPRL